MENAPKWEENNATESEADVCSISDERRSFFLRCVTLN
jgi:hypothetical protein